MQRIIKIAVALLIGVAVLLAHLYHPSQASALAGETIRSLHGPGFGLVSITLMLLFRSKTNVARAYAGAALIALLMAVLSEAAQIPGPREAELRDLVVDALGIVGFLGIAALFDRGMRSRFGRIGIFLVLAVSVPAALLATAPLVKYSHAMVKRSDALPSLLTFDQPWEPAFSQAELSELDIIPAPAGWPEGSGNIAHLRSKGELGLMLHLYPYPDWTGYSAVSFVAATRNGQSQRVLIGLWGIAPPDGGKPGRYYTTLLVGPEPGRHCIDLDEVAASSSDRPFNLSRVYELSVGATRRVEGVEFLVDDFRLERSLEACH